jgi:phospholipid/cholesterol/gamma-HCH transport system substrate-binding protein
MKVMSAAARVGLIVIVFLALGAYAISFLRQDAGDSPNRYRVVMEDASGLSEGSRVLLAGVEVGRVRKIGLNEAGQAEAEIEVRKEIVLKKGVTAQIPTSLVSIGVTELRLEQPANASAVHDPSAPIVGVVANPLEDMIPDLEPTMKEVNKPARSPRSPAGSTRRWRKTKPHCARPSLPRVTP